MSEWTLLAIAIGVALLCLPAVWVSLEFETSGKRAFGIIYTMYIIAAPWLVIVAILTRNQP